MRLLWNKPIDVGITPWLHYHNSMITLPPWLTRVCGKEVMLTLLLLYYDYTSFTIGFDLTQFLSCAHTRTHNHAHRRTPTPTHSGNVSGELLASLFL